MTKNEASGVRHPCPLRRSSFASEVLRWRASMKFASPAPNCAVSPLHPRDLGNGPLRRSSTPKPGLMRSSPPYPESASQLRNFTIAEIVFPIVPPDDAFRRRANGDRPKTRDDLPDFNGKRRLRRRRRAVIIAISACHGEFDWFCTAELRRPMLRIGEFAVERIYVAAQANSHRCNRVGLFDSGGKSRARRQTG